MYILPATSSGILRTFYFFSLFMLLSAVGIKRGLSHSTSNYSNKWYYRLSLSYIFRLAYQGRNWWCGIFGSPEDMNTDL